ncbi:hypothetical protein ABLT31_29265 [Ammoniphilus sp. 3BR4]
MSTLALQFSETSSEVEEQKYKDILMIIIYLHQQDTEVLHFLKEFLPTEAEKIKMVLNKKSCP